MNTQQITKGNARAQGRRVPLLRSLQLRSSWTAVIQKCESLLLVWELFKHKTCVIPHECTYSVESKCFLGDLFASSGSEYHTAEPSKQKRRSQPSRQQVEDVITVHDDESSDSSPSPLSPVKLPEPSKEKKSKLNLKAIFAYHFRGRKFKTAAHKNFRSKRRRRKTETETETKTRTRHKHTYMPTRRPPLTASPQEKRERLLHRGVQFPFVEKHYGTKHIPLKMVLNYEVSPVLLEKSFNFEFILKTGNVIWLFSASTWCATYSEAKLALFFLGRTLAAFCLIPWRKAQLT